MHLVLKYALSSHCMCSFFVCVCGGGGGGGVNEMCARQEDIKS